MMTTALLLGALAFGVGMLCGQTVINWLVARRIGKQIREEGPARHLAKKGTPTMGGLIIFLSVFVVTVPFNLIGRYSILLPLAVLVGTGVLGMVDDLMNLTVSRKGGLRARVKFGILLVIATIAALVIHFGFRASSANIPFVGKYDLGLFYLPIAIVTIVGSANAVNLTDGLDGLAGGLLAAAFAAYGVIAFLQEQAYLVTFCFTVVGATLAFLWFNAHPAQVFMGDTGSLALGATLGTVALMTGHWLLLPIIGIVFVAVTLSVMLQVGYFKLTNGRRIFRMTPLHHHFELSGWSEPQITIRFWLVGMTAAMVGIALALAVP